MSGPTALRKEALAASGNYALNYASANLTVTPARDHGDGGCQEPRLWRCQPGADLSGRRLGPGQRRHTVGCAGDIGDNSQQCRRLRHPQGTLAASANYALNYASANLTVTPRAITVTADAKSRAYGDANPALTYQVGGSGLVNGDTLSGALATSATTSSDAGVYGITQGTLAASSNYAFAFVGANLTVTPAAAVLAYRPQNSQLYVKSRVALPAPQPPEQMREPVSIEQASAAIICKSRQCLELPHPHNRRIGERARFVDTMINRNRLPAFADN